MDINLFPTKGNLILAKNTLTLSRQGYELLDKKRNILIREMMEYIEKAKVIQAHIDDTFKEAYQALQHANILCGIDEISDIAHAIPLEEGIQVRFRSVMGAEIPMVTDETENVVCPRYGFFHTSSIVDESYEKFMKVKELIIQLAEVENAVYRLAVNIKKTQKRANALQNVTIPNYERLTANIQEVLEEKEREEFTRLKVIKNQKQKSK